MSLDSISSPVNALTSRRFVLVGYLPTCMAMLFLLVLLWAGAPGREISFKAAWKTVTGLGASELFAIFIGTVLLAVLLHPLQSALVRLLGGAWPTWLGAGLGRWAQRRRKRALERRTDLLPVDTEPDDVAIWHAGQAGAQLRTRFPLPDHLMRATAMGNALAAMEDMAGRVYGLDAVVAWPRLYAVLGDRVKAVVDDRRDTMDAMARISVSAAVTAIATTALLARAGWWELLALAPVLVAAIAYRGAVVAARAYGEAVHISFDLHRFDLLRALQLPTPTTVDEEKRVNEQLCRMWREGLPSSLSYRPGEPEAPSAR